MQAVMTSMRNYLQLAALLMLLQAPQFVRAEHSAIEDALRATVRITKGQVSGTGFFVEAKDGGGRRTFLVTAAHVFNDMPGPSCTLVLRAKSNNGYVRKETDLQIRTGDKPLWTRHPELDAAAIEVTLPTDCDFKPLPIDAIASPANMERLPAGQDLFVPCFPAKLESNSAGWPILRKASLASYPLAGQSTMFVDYSHFSGDSGAPVVTVTKEGLRVVGLIFAMERQTDKTVAPFEERTLHTPLGLAVAVQAPQLHEVIGLIATHG
jgi:hypothetical protein